MKKNLLLAGLLLAMTLSVSAQYKGFSFGFKLGPGFDWVGSTTGAAHSEKTMTGFGFGVMAEYYFTENYAIVTGVNVNMNRGYYSFESANDSISLLNPFTINRQYKSTVYEIPLILKMVNNQFGALPIRYYDQVGGGIGYAQKVKVKDAIGDAAFPDVWGTTRKEFSNLRASLKIGAGAQYSIDESLRVFLGVFFSHDFLNNISYGIGHNYYSNYYDAAGDKIGERDVKLNMLQNRFGIEAGILF